MLKKGPDGSAHDTVFYATSLYELTHTCFIFAQVTRLKYLRHKDMAEGGPTQDTVQGHSHGCLFMP